MTETTIKKYIPFGEPISPDTAQGGFGFIPNGIREKNIFFYHPDHLGSSSYITGQDGKVSQHTEYIAFGEILFDEHNTEHTMPYLFNGKELDSETGLYYYGARYYDPRVSIFLNVDPLAEKTMTPYAYTNNNPIMLVDPDGRSGEDPPNLSGVTNVKNVLQGKKWIPYMSKTIEERSWSFSWSQGPYRQTTCRTGECADYSRLQVKQGGDYTAVGAKNRIDMYIKKGGDKSKLDLQKGINTIINNLKKGRAVMAGVMYNPDKETGNPNSATNHYVTIVGMGKDDKGTYFSYYDNYTGEGHTEQTKQSVGTDIKLNRFRLHKTKTGTYYFSDGADGNIPYNQNKNVQLGNDKGLPARYVLTEVRDNK